jgi:hypothetical protein
MNQQRWHEFGGFHLDSTRRLLYHNGDTKLTFVNNIGSVAYCPNNHCSPGAGLTSDLTG